MNMNIKISHHTTSITISHSRTPTTLIPLPKKNREMTNPQDHKPSPQTTPNRPARPP